MILFVSFQWEIDDGIKRDLKKTVLHLKDFMLLAFVRFLCELSPTVPGDNSYTYLGAVLLTSLENCYWSD